MQNWEKKSDALTFQGHKCSCLWGPVGSNGKRQSRVSFIRPMIIMETMKIILRVTGVPSYIRLSRSWGQRKTTDFLHPTEFQELWDSWIDNISKWDLWRKNCLKNMNNLFLKNYQAVSSPSLGEESTSFKGLLMETVSEVWWPLPLLSITTADRSGAISS